MTGEEDKSEGFLRRWSRRKGSQSRKENQESGAETQTALAEPAEEAALELPPEAPVRGRMITSAPGETTTPQNAEEPEEIDEADLQDVESLEADSDFTPFLKKGVSEQLQRRALRKLWLSDPVLANVDGLLDYGDDFTDAAMVVADMKTAYKVGRGMVPPPEEELPEEELADEELPNDELPEEESEGGAAEAAVAEGDPAEGEKVDGDADAETASNDESQKEETAGRVEPDRLASGESSSDVPVRALEDESDSRVASVGTPKTPAGVCRPKDRS